MIMWTVLLEGVNILSYIYAIQRTPNRFLAELGSTGTRDTILTHGAIMDEVAMISGLMGYLAIITFALARMMVANQGSQITGAFSGTIGGLGLSAFAGSNLK